MIDWLFGWLGLLVCWLLGWFVGWLNGGRLVTWLVRLWSVGLLVVVWWCIGLFVGWLVGQFVG